MFLNKKKRQAITDRFSSLLSAEKYIGDSLAPGLMKSPMVGLLSASARASARMGARVLMGFRADELATAQRKWQAREISNVRRIMTPSHGHLMNMPSSRT